MIGLVAMCLIGVGIWLATYKFFLGLIPPSPVGEPEPKGSWSETLFVTLGLFGLFIWPTLLSVGYLIWSRVRAHRIDALQWVQERELRNARQAELNTRIEAAQAAGVIKRPEKS